MLITIPNNALIAFTEFRELALYSYDHSLIPADDQCVAEATVKGYENLFYSERSKIVKLTGHRQFKFSWMVEYICNMSMISQRLVI